MDEKDSVSVYEFGITIGTREIYYGNSNLKKLVKVTRLPPYFLSWSSHCSAITEITGKIPQTLTKPEHCFFEFKIFVVRKRYSTKFDFY